jgi:REP element-mobilizing transposase RayT
MAGAKRRFLPGYAWHITHRRHKKEFLLKFARDRKFWMGRLFGAKKRYGLRILNHIATSNHMHLLVLDGGKREIIPRSMQLTAGRAAQEFKQRKKRKGAAEIFGIGKQDIQPTCQLDDWTKVVVFMADIFLISTAFDIMV